MPSCVVVHCLKLIVFWDIVTNKNESCRMRDSQDRSRGGENRAARKRIRVAPDALTLLYEFVCLVKIIYWHMSYAGCCSGI